MRYSNKYHKFSGEIQKRVEGSLEFVTLRLPIEFDYFNEVKTQSFPLFKGYNIHTGNTTLITQDINGLEVDDRLWVDESAAIVTALPFEYEKTLSGNRYNTNNKTYLIILEGG